MVALYLLGCAPVRGMHRPPTARAGSGHLLAGASRVDLTPVPGHTLGGHSIDAGEGLGTWMGLQARAIYLEDPDGTPLILVACELWAMPAGLVDRVSELIGENPNLAHVGREDILLAATHTHHSPASYLSNLFFNRFAGARPGFDPELHEFLARRIFEAIQSAHGSRTPARANWTSSIVDGLARNRSFEPFLANPEAPDILKQSDQWGISKCEPIEHPPAGTNSDPLRCRAVYPKLGVLSLVAESEELIASAAFVAVHPTVMPNDVNLYHGDFFGVATRVAEQHLGTRHGSRPVVALFNGAQGDVSPAWTRHDHGETLRLGSLLASAIVDSTTQVGISPGTEIVNRYREVQIADVNTRHGRTSNRPVPGKGQLGGAEDHRTVWHKRGYHEGVVSTHERYRGQGNKRPALPIALLALGVPKSALPDHAPLAVHRLGHLVFTGVPGEITTTLGRRIRENVARVNEDIPVLIGLANEYLAYFTTPEEYALQHYEGASMLYGPHTAEVLLRGTGALADPRTTYRQPAKSDYFHRPGRRVHRSKPSIKMRRKLAAGPAKLSKPFPIENVRIQATISTAPPAWPDPAEPMIPKVTLENRSAGTWRPHPDNEIGWIVLLEQTRRSSWTWGLYWIGPTPSPEKTWRIRATVRRNESRCFPEFSMVDNPVTSPLPTTCKTPN